MSIKTSVQTEVIRCFDSSKCEGYERPPYKAVITITYLGNGVAVASPAHGEFSRKDINLIYAHVKAQGAHSLLAERSPGHRIPKGKEVTQGEFVGWHRVVL